MDKIKQIHRYVFTFKRFFKTYDIDILAFSLQSAIEKFYALFPRGRITSIIEVAV